jgi:predicted XRE-type DNA-binding protein
MSEILKAAQKAIRDSGLTPSQVAKELDIPLPRVSEFMKASELRGLMRVEQVLEKFAKDKYEYLKK